MEFDSEKISFDELMLEYAIPSMCSLKIYLKEVWRDLSERSSDKNEGVNKITFSKYYELPGFLADRVFSLFDIDKNNFLNRDEFIQGMLSIFSSNYNKLTTLIFKIYDFENTGFISREDVRTILSHISIKSHSSKPLTLSNNTSDNINYSFKFDRETFQDRLESQEELHSLLNKSFKFEKKIDFTTFIYIIENIDSDIFLYLLIFLLEKSPFSHKTLENYKFIRSDSDDQEDKKIKIEETHFRNRNSLKTPTINAPPAYFSRGAKSPTNLASNTSKLLASPTLLSKFSPTESISKSPSLQKKKLNMDMFYNGSLGFSNISNEGSVNPSINAPPLAMKNTLMKYLQNSDKCEKSKIPSLNSKAVENQNGAQEATNQEYVEVHNIPLNKNVKKGLNELNESKNLFLQHLGIQQDLITTHRSNSNFDDSDVSSNISNIDQADNENFMKNEISNDKINNGNLKEKEILTVDSNRENTTNNNKAKLLNFENLQKNSNAPSSNKSSGSTSVNNSNPNSARSSKLDENQLYPSKKYENDINYLNKKIFQASIINQKLTIDKQQEKNKNSNKNITLKIPDISEKKDEPCKDTKIEEDKKEFKSNIKNIIDKKANLLANNLLQANLSNFSSNSSLEVNILKENFSQKSGSTNDVGSSTIKESQIYREGYLSKITYSNKLKRLFFKLSGKDFYYYKTSKDQIHKGMHNITGVFIKEEKKTKFEGQDLFCFSLVYPFRVRKYYTESFEDYQKWLTDLKKVLGYETLEDQYELKEVLGKGKFGLVKLAIHKNTGRKVAVKIIGKKNIDYSDLEMIKNEIEILKICQHPNIIKLYDVFENSDFIYLITEYLEGGDLFNYLQKRNFKLSEARAANLVHQILAAVYYLNSYGIIHRDLKPENLVMTDNSEDARVKILDFGLSKIIGPNELCHDPYGTIAYCAPEILLDQYYGKTVDSWSIGIITYLMLCGFLPFDHESSIKEIARKTVQDKTPFPVKVWKDLSEESKKFVDALLNKNPEKRLCVSDALEHAWFRNHVSNKLVEIRKVKKKFDKFVFDLYTSTEVVKASNEKQN